MQQKNNNNTQIVLIVDDSPFNIQTLAEILTNEVKVLVANRGSKALEIASRQPKPDLILLDIMMPDMDGYEICRRLKSDVSTQDIPVIFVTAKGEVEYEEKGLNLGAVDYITKPFSLAIVRARVKTHLSLKRKTDLLNQLTREDQLSGVANRRGFDETLEREFRRCQRDNQPLSLLMIDIDHFKLFNDQFGHRAGDECLKKVAVALKDGLHRGSDFIARYGGEEFAVLLPDTDHGAATNIAEQLRQRVIGLAIPQVVAGNDGVVSISLGVATIVPANAESKSFSELVEEADKKLYEAKAAGRNCVK